MNPSNIGTPPPTSPRQEHTQVASPEQKESNEGAGRAASAQNPTTSEPATTRHFVSQQQTTPDQTRASNALSQKRPVDGLAGASEAPNIPQSKNVRKARFGGLGGLNLKVMIPKTITKAEMKAERNIEPPRPGQLYELTNAIKNTVKTEFAVTGGFALELHSQKINTPAHRMVNDVDIITRDYRTFLMELSENNDFDTSNASMDEDNGWVIHKPSNQIFDVLQANRRFGGMEQIEMINGLPVEPLSALSKKLQSMTGKVAPDKLEAGLAETDGIEKRLSDLAFIESLRSKQE